MKSFANESLLTMSSLNNIPGKSMPGHVAFTCLLLLIPCAGSPQRVEKNIPLKKSGYTATSSNNNKISSSAKKPVAIAKIKPKGSSSTQSSSDTGKIKGSTGTSQPSKANAGTPRVSVEAPQISYFNQDGKGWLRAGQMVHITMQGTSGARAAFCVVGLSETLPMLENAPGQYIANWTVPSDKSLPGMKALVTGDLSLSSPQTGSPSAKTAPTMTASLPLCVDTVAPSVQNIMPAPQTTGTIALPTISIDYKDEGSGIDISSVRLILNGRDLTGEASITTERLTYKPFIPLLEGDQAVEIFVGDKAGNVFRQVWHFAVKSK